MNNPLEFDLEISKNKLPCLWESGGGYSNTGDAQIITDKNGEEKRPIYIKTSGERACLNHALIPIRKGDHVINLNRHRDNYRINICEIDKINIDKKIATCNTKNVFKYNKWKKELNEKFDNAVNAAIDKSNDYHCRDPYFVLPLKKDEKIE